METQPQTPGSKNNEQEEETENGGTVSGWETGGVFLKVIHRQVMWVDSRGADSPRGAIIIYNIYIL